MADDNARATYSLIAPEGEIYISGNEESFVGEVVDGWTVSAAQMVSEKEIVLTLLGEIDGIGDLTVEGTTTESSGGGTGYLMVKASAVTEAEANGVDLEAAAIAAGYVGIQTYE